MGYAAEAGDRDQRRIGVEPVLHVEQRADARIMRSVIDRAANRVDLDEPQRGVHRDEAGRDGGAARIDDRSEEHTSELQSLMRTSYAVFCLKKKNKNTHKHICNKKSRKQNTLK